MSNASEHIDASASQGDRVPVCQWSFNRAYQFHHVGGDAAGVFDRVPAELLRRHVSLIDDAQGSWASRLHRMFSGQTAIERWTGRGGQAFIHVPVRDKDRAVAYTVGFAFPAGSASPHASELEFAAALSLQALETERMRVTRFLHDVVAQTLSGTGLQLELLLAEIRAGNASALKRATDIQQSLEQVLELIREFNAPDYRFNVS
jgi:signal transduction histidine kinase